MALPVTIPNQFANATSSIPLSQLDTNFNTLSNAVNGINSGAETLANLVATTANVTTGNITTVNATTVDTTNIEVTNVKAKDGTASATIADSTGVMTIASSVLTTTDINGGTLDNVVIGGANAAAITGTTITADTSVSTDTISEKTSAAGVTIDSVLLKDNKVTANELTINSNNISADNSMGFRNRIINGDMRIDQRNAGASVTPADGAYTLDRWVYLADQASKCTIEQTISGVSAPSGFTDYLGVTSTAATTITTSQQFSVVQRIEGYNMADLAWGTASAKTVTLSFWVRSSLTGTFGGAIRNDDGNYNYPFSYTISAANTWEQKSVTITGATSGTWLTTNGRGMQVVFGLGAGATLSGTAGAWSTSNFWSATGATQVLATNGATFYITGVQLEVGSVATPFERRPYGTELSLCQRYYYKNLPNAASAPFGSGFATAATNAGVYIPFPVTMRTAPTALEQTGTAGDYAIIYRASVTACNSAPVFATGGTTGAHINMGISSVLTQGDGVIGRAVNTSAYLAWSAEI